MRIGTRRQYVQQLDQKVQSSTSKKIQLPVEDVLKRGGVYGRPETKAAS
jgi:hypothetical protein